MLHITTKDMFDETIKPGDIVWSLEVNDDFDIKIEKWLLEQVNNTSSVSLLFVSETEKKRSVKSIRMISKDKDKIIHHIMTNLTKQYQKYEINMQRLQSLLEEKPTEMVAIQNTEEEI